MKTLFLYGEPQKYDNYANAVQAAGGVILRSTDCSLANDCDGLLLPGGGDIDPARYGAHDNGSVEIDPLRDEAEFSLIRKFAVAGKPILGICRGHQVLNVFFGGSLIGHLKNTAAHAPGTAGEPDQEHFVSVCPGSYLAVLYGLRFNVNSYHHQAVDRLGSELLSLADSQDGINEAFCHQTMPILGVQWHPERLSPDPAKGQAGGLPLLRYFLSLVP